MRRLLAVGVGVTALVAGTAAYLFAHRSPSPEEQWALVDKYCAGCHNNAEFAGDLAFARLSRTDLAADAVVWEKAIRKLRGHLMPPPGEPRPSDARIDTFVNWLEQSLDAAARSKPNPGAPALHRLNRAEYANAVRDL